MFLSTVAGYPSHVTFASVCQMLVNILPALFDHNPGQLLWLFACLCHRPLPRIAHIMPSVYISILCLLSGVKSWIKYLVSLKAKVTI